jgi:hypothetical protein
MEKISRWKMRKMKAMKKMRKMNRQCIVEVSVPVVESGALELV